MNKKTLISLFFAGLIFLTTVNYSQYNPENIFNPSQNYKLYSFVSHDPYRNLLYERSFTDIENNFTETKNKASSLSLKIERAPDYTKAGLITGIFVGYGLPLTPLKGNTTTISVKNSSTSAASYFAKIGITGGISEKLPIGKKGNFRLVMNFSYSYFFQSGNDSIGIYTIKPKMQIFQIGLGGEYAFAPIDRFEPFLGIELTGNVFGGSTEFLNNALGTDTVRDMNMVTRYGVTFGAGVNYKINKDVGLVFGAKYSLTNLIGRSSDVNGARELNDAAYTLDGSNISAKTISFMSFYAGLSIYLGSALREIPW